jgi:hypothetical protein
MEKTDQQRAIDFVKIFQKLWPHKKKYCYVMGTTLIVTYLLTVCVPRYYKCTISLAPETGGTTMSGSLSSLASSFGLSSMANTSQDAIFADIYPDVLASKNFIAELMTVNIKTSKGDVECDYYTYLRDKQNAAWWNKLMSSITEWIKPTPTDPHNGKTKLSVFNLTKQQDNLFEAVKGKIKCIIDKKTGMINITVTDQDPMVCAIMADSTSQKLQDFIVQYRTNKARIDYEYYKNLCAEAKIDYENARKLYSSYADANQDIYLTSYKTEIENLENEMQLKYNTYTSMSSQMQNASAKLQEATPAFSVIESASVPTRPAGPKRMIISIFMMILSFFALSGWLLVKNY